MPQPHIPEFPDSFKEASVYQLIRARGHTTYYYPQAGSILSLPFVAVANAFGLSAATPAGALDFRGEVILQPDNRIAADGDADLCNFPHGLDNAADSMEPGGRARSRARHADSSTASRGLWSQTWQILVLGVLVDALLSHEHRGTRAHPLWIATLVAWVYFTRPTGSIAIVTVSIYVFLFSRENFITYAAALTVWLAGFVGYSLVGVRHHDTAVLLRQPLQVRRYRLALFGNLASPARGLFVYVPAVLFAILSGRAILADARTQALGDSRVLHIRPTCDRDFNSSRMVGGLCYGADCLPM